MGTLIDTFHEAISAQSEAALVALVSRQPQTTIAELAELLASNPRLGATTLTTLLGNGRVAATPKRRGRPPGRKAASVSVDAPAPAAKRKAGGSGKRNVRTESGRGQFDQDVLAALRDAGGDSVSATALRGIVGGDPIQLRTSLNRLIANRLVTFTGKARGTRYSLAGDQQPEIRREAPGRYVSGRTRIN